MTINSVDDIEMLRVVEKIPKGTHRLRGFTMRAEKKLTNETEYVAAVRLTKNGPLMKFSKPNIEEVVENYTDLAFAVFHELLHVLEGHLNLDRIRNRYRVPGLFEGHDSIRQLEGNERDVDLEDRRLWKIIHFVNELEVKHMEHVLLPDEFQEMNRRLYSEDVDREDVDEIPANKRVLYRGNEDFDNPVYERLHNRVFSDSRYSPLEAFRVLDNVLPDVPDEDEQGGGGGGGGTGGGNGDSEQGEGGGSGGGASGESGSGQGGGSGGEEEDGDQENGGGSGEGDEEDEDDGGSGSGEGEQEDDEQGEGEEGQGEEDDEENGGQDEEGSGEPDVSENDPLDHTESGIDEDANAEDVRDLVDALSEMADDPGDDSGDASKSEDAGDQPGGSGHTLDPQVAEAKRQAPVDQPKNDEVEEEIKKSGTAPDFHSKVAADIRDEVGNAIRYSVRPNFKDDHRARIDRKVGSFTPRYKHSRAPNREKIALYYDISGSQTQYIPACNQIVLHNKKYLADRSVFLFAIGVQKMSISTFSKRAQEGTVQNAVNTYGTNFNDVIRHVKEQGFRKIVVLTDDISELDDDLIGPMVRGGDLEHILVVCTEKKADYAKQTSPGFIHGGPQDGYADEVVYVEPVTH